MTIYSVRDSLGKEHYWSTSRRGAEQWLERKEYAIDALPAHLKPFAVYHSRPVKPRKDKPC